MLGKRIGQHPGRYNETLRSAAGDGLLELRDDAVTASEQGFRFLDDLLLRFMPTRVGYTSQTAEH